MVLNGALLDLVQVAVCVMLGSLLLFAGQYLLAGGWFRSLLGWSVLIKQVAFILLLVLVLLQDYFPTLVLASTSQYLLAEAILLLVAAVGVNLGNVVMYDLRQHPVPVLCYDPVTGAGRQPRP